MIEVQADSRSRVDFILLEWTLVELKAARIRNTVEKVQILLDRIINFRAVSTQWFNFSNPTLTFRFRLAIKKV
jgi:hypothetical protein